MTRPLLIRVILVSALLSIGCGSEEADAETSEATRPYVEVVESREGSLPLEERVSGRIRAANQVAIRPEIEAPIIEVRARNGQRVRQGQVLVRQSSSVLADQVREAEASLRLAQASATEARANVEEVASRLRRTRALAREKLVSPQELETLEARLSVVEAGAAQARARVDQAAATLAERRRELGRATIRAPISGTIGGRDAEIGMIAGPSDVLFVIGDLDELIVEIPLTEQMLGYVREGQPVRITSPRLTGGSIEGTIARISPFLDEGTMSTVGEVEIRNLENQLQPGMFVEVDLLYGESDRATLVPSSAIWEDPETGEITAYVVSDRNALGDRTDPVSIVARRQIAVRGEGRLATAVGGIEPGEWVVVLGQHLLEGEAGEARLRSTTWERVVELQSLQREDLLEGYLAKQQRLARILGPRPLSNEEFLGSAAPVDPETVNDAAEGL